ncbi:M20/M25/M40 family metallo-hydrolase [Herbidospora mongoliensis]|uniref:M20/M25/M40 family metallo-hydrolase n=1 Tax=Herbidospora mongoliensis TaxID=688067 RepID=UPI000A941371|nr:M20/M25/M40 family metallo-hydrolase [Herbidospora mongoliensis]
MSVLGEVATTHTAALYVIKIGSASLAHETVFDEVARLRGRGAKILLVAGGAAGISAHYEAIGRPVRSLALKNGSTARYCPPAEMDHIVAAYERVTLPRVREALTSRGLTCFTSTAQAGSLVTADLNPPLRARLTGPELTGPELNGGASASESRSVIVRDHRAGTVSEVATECLTQLLDAFDVVCVAPPAAASDGGSPLNIDADVLAAELANALDADHLRLVTGTPGLLADPSSDISGIPDIGRGEGLRYAQGRMRQKVRAAEIALDGNADVAITGPHSLEVGTRFWRADVPADDLTLLTRAVEISSVSRDERELAEYLVSWCHERDIDAEVDEAGNFVASKGSGRHRLLMLGHLDTVPHRWPVQWDDGTISGRGCVDAKGSLVAYLETLHDLDVPPDVQIRVVGAVEEEITSAGAFFVRDHYKADAVIIGEPSGAGALTIGYYGLLKVRIGVADPVGHTAGQGVTTAADQMVDVLARIRSGLTEEGPDALLAVLGIHAVNGGDVQLGEAVLDVRVPSNLALDDLVGLIRDVAQPVEVEVLRATPGHVTARTSPLVKAFSRAFRAEGVVSRFLAKKGSSDMNTLATTWQGVPMVAYGPGDAKLDHTPHEHLEAAEYRQARSVLSRALAEWIAAESQTVRRAA